MDAITFLQQLVAISSLSGAEQEASHWMAEQMMQLGFDAAFVDSAGNSVGIRANPDENGAITKELMLLGHIDTVPGDIPVRIEDGKLYGRGSVDAKGPLATFVMAAAQAQLPTGVRVVVVGAVEEEAATSKGAHHVLTQYRPDWCIIGEPSGWNGVTLGYKGVILIDYHHGQGMSHTAGELLGSAEVGIAWYNQLIAYVTAYNETRPKLFDQILPSIRSISTQSDGMINAISIKLGLRLPPQFDINEFERQLREWAGEQATIALSGYEEAYSTTRQTPLARLFHRALLRRGTSAQYKVKTGTSDMNVVGPIWNCPIVAYGPGDSSLDHTPHEHLDTEEYLKAIDVLTAVLSQSFA